MATLEDLVQKNGGDAVIFYDGAVEYRITYDQLNEAAESIVRVLDRFLKTDFDDSSRREQVVVGIHMDTGLMLPACILGIMKASCCFLYLAPNESVAYLTGIIHRAKVRYLIYDQDTMANQLSTCLIGKSEVLFNGKITIAKLLPKDHAGRLASMLNSSKLAYIMFTSGTTGDSKMVRVPHCCIVPNILHLWNEYHVTTDDVIFLSSPLTFDPSIVDIFLAFSSGATLLIVADVLKTQPSKLASTLFNRFGVTILQTTPTLLSRFPSTVLKRILCPSSLDSNVSLRILTLGGEPFPVHTLAPYLYGVNIGLSLSRLRIYNIYGPTEVSCWSTLHRVTWDDIRTESVPVGRAMLDTEIQLLDSKGQRINQSGVTGELYVGGLERRCFLDDETICGNLLELLPRLRPTGDMAVQIRDNAGIVQYMLIGRTDDQTKRMGKRLNLLQIAQVIEGHANVKRCVVLLDRWNTLRAYVQLHASNSHTRYNHIIDQLRKIVQRSLPSHCQPDFFHFIAVLPMTKHGKVDKKALMEKSVCPDLPQFSPTVITDVIIILLQHFIGSDQINISNDSYIRQLGIDSLKALAMVQTLEQWSKHDLPKAFEIMMIGKVSMLVDNVKSSVANKHTYVKQTLVHRANVSSNGLLSTAKRFKSNVQLSIMEKGGRKKVIGADASLYARKLLTYPSNMKFKFKWKWDSGKCVDASPVVVTDFANDNTRVFIGSHSGKFVCLESRTGTVVWTQQLSDRIEASATVSACGQYVIVGCYDGSVHFIDRLLGTLWWKFETMDVVKCTALVTDPPIVYIGSHDHYLYKLDYNMKMCVWKTDLGSAIFSTPVLTENMKLLFVATLGGTVYCLTSDEGTQVWQVNLGKPIFSSLLTTGDTVIITATVDGFIYWLRVMDGNMMRFMKTDGHIFSTPVIIHATSSRMILITCESGSVYSLQDNGDLVLWKNNLGSPILSTPFVLDALFRQEVQSLCCITTKSGTVHILRLDNGEILDSYDLGQEVFSSPVVADSCVFVGCRDDNVYCLEISNE